MKPRQVREHPNIRRCLARERFRKIHLS